MNEQMKTLEKIEKKQKPTEDVNKKTSAGKVEQFVVKQKSVQRSVTKRDGSVIVTSLPLSGNGNIYSTPDEAFDKEWLKATKSPKYHKENQTQLNLADLFSGFGGMTLGVVEAGKALNIEIQPKLAIDFDADSIDTYKLNFPNADCRNTDICNLIDGKVGERPTKQEKALVNQVGEIQLLIGGPPCQGNSDLNNHTRRKDPKNSLLLKVVRFAELFRPLHIIIENVQGVQHDTGKVVEKAKNHLSLLGYNIHEGLLLASKYGVAQNRRRYFLVATVNENFNFALLESSYSRSPRSFNWACQDLLHLEKNDVFNTSAKHSTINQRRIEYLFHHDLYELPDHQRPDCHKNGNHSYKSVYGRMYPDRPSPTITGGFGSIGQGRFCHPLKQRSITPHEAARLQFVPDFLRFPEDSKRVSLQTMIGNAVPSKLSYLLTLDLLR